MKGIKTGGREQGTPNKLTFDLRERISDFLNQNWELIEKDFQVLQPEKRVILFEKLLQYSLPRLQATELITQSQESIEESIIEQMTDEEREAELDRLRHQLWPEAWEVMNKNNGVEM